MARTRKAKADEKPTGASVEPKDEPAAPALSVAPTVQKGDIVWLDYEGWIVNPNGTRTLFDTTREELAKKEGKWEEKKVYADFPIVLGQGRLLPGLDEALLTAEVGKDAEVTISPERGAGERDPKLVELHPLREFLRQEIHPELGMEVSVKGRKGSVTQVTGGRVRVDYNNPLAGRTLHYSYRITKKAGTPEERLRGVLEMDYGLSSQFGVAIDRGVAEVVVPDICKTDERWFVAKFRVIADLRELLGFEKVRFIEEYVKPPPKPEPPKEEAKPEPERAAEPEAPKEERREEPAPPAPEEERAEEELPPEEKAPEEL